MARVHAGTAMKLTLLLATGLLLAWAAHQMGLAAIIGAFAAGVLLEPVFLKEFETPPIVRQLQPLAAYLPAAQASQLNTQLHRYAQHHHEHLLEPLGHFLVPVFFVYTGMQVNLSSLADLQTIGIALALSLVAIIGKVCAGLGAVGAASPWQVGWGMVPRGEVGLIFAAVGKQLGVVDDQLFSIIVAMVIITTVVTPPVLSWLLSRAPLKTETSAESPTPPAA